MILSFTFRHFVKFYRSSPIVTRMLGLLLGLNLGVSEVSAATWQKVVTPQFTLYSSGKSADALRVAQEFQQFIGALREIVRINPRALPPLTIVMFDRDKEFRPFRPRRPNGKPWDVAGFFSRQEGWSVFGLSGVGLDDEVRRTVFHEGVHWFMSSFDLPNPPWLEEGLAEVFSTFVVEKGKREWGQPIGVHVQVLHSSNPLPLERLLSVSRTDPLFNESQRTGLFYAESWAFVHYLLFGEHNRERTLFNEYLKAFRRGVHPDESFRTVFKKDYAGMDRELFNYLRSGKYFVGSRPLSAEASTLKVEPVSEVERDIALAHLALGADRLDLAQEYISSAQRVAPDSALVSEVAGYLASARGDTAGMLEHFAKAAQNGSTDYRIYFDPAQRLHQSGSGPEGRLGLSPKEARQIADGYEKTINLRPWFLPAYQGLGGIIELLRPKNQEDRKFLELGQKQFPNDGLIVLGLAAASHQSGETDDALQLLGAVLSRADQLPTSVNGYAQRLDESWKFEKSSEKIRLLVEAGQFEEAVIAVDELLAKGVPFGSRGTILLDRANLEASVQMKQAQTAWNERRWSDARKLIEKVLASPVQTGAKYEARRRLAELDRRNLGRD